MSNTVIEKRALLSASKAKDSLTSLPSQLATRLTLSPWAWLTATCVFLLISGGVRFWRDRQFSSLEHESKSSPFRLGELPDALGNWHAVPGSEQQLDEITAVVAGSSDNVSRAYTNSTTGETASMLVLYGLATSVFAHTPDACYPTAGYQPVVASVDREFSLPGSSKPVRYRVSHFGRTVGGVTQYKEVLCSFLYNGNWVPDVASQWKSFRYHPGMFKIQIERSTSGIASQDSPTESLLKETVRAIENRLPSKIAPK
jgi:hypothetical protein